MRNTSLLIIGSLLAGGSIFSSVLTVSLPEDLPVSSQKAVIQVAEFASVARTEQEEVAAAAAGHYKLNLIRAFAQQNSVSSPSSSSSSSRAPVRPKQKLFAVIDQPEIELKHRKIADEALRLMPERCQDTLKSFYVRYDNPEHRGLAGKSVMVLDGGVPDDEFRALFIHEFGHVLDLGCYQGNPAKGESRFVDGKDPILANDPSLGFYEISWMTSTTQRSDAKPEDFVSGYASYDVFEDFAETFAYFVLQNETFQERAATNAALKAKYDWLALNVFGGNPAIADGQSEWTGSVPWDTTKLGYIWHGGQNVALKQ